LAHLRFGVVGAAGDHRDAAICAKARNRTRAEYAPARHADQNALADYWRAMPIAQSSPNANIPLFPPIPLTQISTVYDDEADALAHTGEQL